MSGVAITASKSVQSSVWIFVHHVVAAHDIGPGFLRLALLVAGGDHQHFLGLAEPVGQHHGAAHHLVGVLGIDAQAQVQLDGLIELGELDLLDQRNGLDRWNKVSARLAQRRQNIFYLICGSCLDWSKRRDSVS